MATPQSIRTTAGRGRLYDSILDTVGEGGIGTARPRTMFQALLATPGGSEIAYRLVSYTAAVSNEPTERLRLALSPPSNPRWKPTT